jgi:agmatinase
MKIVKVPWDLCEAGTVGTGIAPKKVLEKTNEQLLTEDGILPLFDVTEVEALKKDMQSSIEKIYRAAGDAFKSNAKPLFLGGSHAITLPIVRAFLRVYPENPGIIIFDAHPDAKANFSDAQEDLLLGLVNNGIIKKENIILVGTRSWDKEEYVFLKKNKIKYFPMKEISANGIHEVSDSFMSVAKNFSDLYVSIDIDVLDPAFAPGTHCAEPGGLTTRQLLYFLGRIKKLRNLRGFDLAEVNPAKDVNDMTSRVGAKILVELC